MSVVERTAVDARGRQISLERPPSRIISLVPSQTELLSSLGLDDEVVGITRFCVHPPGWASSKRIIGGTKVLRTDRIEELRPDLIIANIEENTREDVERLEHIAPVFVTNVPTLDDALDMIESIAHLVGRSMAGREISSVIERGFVALDRERRNDTSSAGIRTAYLIWRAPFMTVGIDTFIHEIMQRGGFANVFAPSLRYPELSVADLVDSNPDVVFLSSEPFPFSEKHLSELRELLPTSQIVLVDGQLFSWYGSRLIHTPDYLRRLRREIVPAP